jgi:ATP-dependent Zn protease
MADNWREMKMDGLTAYHEAGHATVGYLFDEMPEEVVIRTSIVPT